MASPASPASKGPSPGSTKEFVKHGRTSSVNVHHRLPLRSRIQHFTWAWYTLTMSTGGISLLLHLNPHQFTGLHTIGTILFILDLLLFLLITTILLIRFILYPGTLSRSLHHVTESLFIPTFPLTVAILLSLISDYGAQSLSNPAWLVTVLRILFWIYVSSSFLLAIAQYHILFTIPVLTLQSMTPAWLLPIFPTMLSGTLASSIAGNQPAEYAGAIIVAGTTFQGLGILVAILMYSNYIGRLIAYGLPHPNTRPGMFIAVGPPSFTAIALIGLANDADKVYGSSLDIGASGLPTTQVLKVMAVVAAVFLWALALFFFSISLLATLSGFREMRFHLSWWSFVFPNTGFIISMIQIGNALGSEGILWTASVATVLQVALWLFVACMNARALWRREVLWPGKDEDRDE